MNAVTRSSIDLRTTELTRESFASGFDITLVGEVTR